MAGFTCTIFLINNTHILCHQTLIIYNRHGIKFQSVYLPCGMVMDIYGCNPNYNHNMNRNPNHNKGPCSIRHNDRYLIAESDLNECIALAQRGLPPTEQLVSPPKFPAVLINLIYFPKGVYGDSIYVHDTHVHRFLKPVSHVHRPYPRPSPVYSDSTVPDATVHRLGH